MGTESIPKAPREDRLLNNSSLHQKGPSDLYLLLESLLDPPFEPTKKSGMIIEVKIQTYPEVESTSVVIENDLAIITTSRKVVLELVLATKCDVLSKLNPFCHTQSQRILKRLYKMIRLQEYQVTKSNDDELC